MSLSLIPTELLLQISTHVQLQGLAALTRTSSRCYEILNPELYARGIASGLVMHMLFLAAEKGLPNTARACLSRRPSVPAEAAHYGLERKLLQRAAELGHAEVVKQLLLWEFSDPNAGNGGTFETPLKIAIFGGHTGMVQVFLEHDRVDCNFEDDYNRFTPLHLAAMRGFVDIAKLLLERADIKLDEQDFYRRTPLSYAAERGNTEVARLLLERNEVNHEAKDKEGKTPLDYAVSEGRAAVVRLLLAASATSSNDHSVLRDLKITAAAHARGFHKKSDRLKATIKKMGMRSK
ncbi:ankyrin repeats (3 copies) domain-containing protein [Purpureocillium lavendulum]|uniref:Ankyrin repeats (3 copies) domain-containing protein n=1 Tax=Purpureocillium lavendulum TaxID=1247861 RepID=A0AB34FTR5_9HYPO|nr:ankyrin repeats (3 copies) domain-containing protein [Purpureocillium lavendulum]